MGHDSYLAFPASLSGGGIAVAPWDTFLTMLPRGVLQAVITMSQTPELALRMEMAATVLVTPGPSPPKGTLASEFWKPGAGTAGTAILKTGPLTCLDSISKEPRIALALEPRSQKIDASGIRVAIVQTQLALINVWAMLIGP